MKIQHNKCAYCEQQIEGGQLGSIAHDLEHFRPKGNVCAWPNPHLQYPFPTGAAFPTGYFRLAYHLGNYLVACKICNTILKSDYFPIAGARISDGNHPDDYLNEKAYLIYPIGNNDDDPKDIIGFYGTQALALHSNGPKHNRATIIIDFFDLNREALIVSRAFTLLAVWEAYKGSEKQDSDSIWFLDRLTSEMSAHTACAKAFLLLCEANRAEAAALVAGFQKSIKAMYSD